MNNKIGIIIPDADNTLRTRCVNKAKMIYGYPLPSVVNERLNKELEAIITNNYSSHYLFAADVAEKANSLGYPITTRGLISSSFIAYLCGITMVNPLPPHYSCPSCHYFEEVKIDIPYNIQGFDLNSIHGYDLLNKVCPVCSNEIKANGNDIKSEILMGKDYTREPNIILNIPPSIRRNIIVYIKEKYREYQIIRAGVSFRTHTGEIRKSVHPGGIYIVPKDIAIDNYTPLREYDSDDEFQIPITVKDFHEIDKVFTRYDILSLPLLDMLHDLAVETNISLNDIELNDGRIIDVFQKERYSFIPNLSRYQTENKVEQEIFSCYTPVRFSDIVKIRGLMSGINT